MNPPPSEPDLTFHWPSEKGFPYVLFVCVAGSLFAHAATFFLFQVVYPQRVTIPQPAPHVSLVTPTSPENIVFLRWIEAEDPALIADDNSVEPPTLAAVRYIPSFAAPRTAPLSAPDEKTQGVAFPPAVDRLVAAGTVPPSETIASSAGRPTLIQFAEALATRPLAKNPALAAPRLATAPVEPTVLLVGVRGDGGIGYQILQQSSGDPKLDDLAVAHLHRLSFAPTGAAMTWAHVTFAWGADAYEGPASAGGRSPRVP